MMARVFRSVDEARGRFGPCALAIGNFDGVHLGHQKLIAETVSCARRNGLTPAVITFDPHPTAIVAPERVPPLICPLEERLRLIAAAGAEHILVLNFTPEISRLSPAEFVEQILVDALQTKAVLVGENFRFGYRQEGTPETLQRLGARHGFNTCFLEPVKFRGQIISSSAVRSHLKNGNVLQAARFLGRCYSLAGPVVSGRGIGSKQAVPTLNLMPAPELVVPHGIYVTETFDVTEKFDVKETFDVTETFDNVNQRRWPSVTSCGYNPTFGATDLTVETYLLTALENNSPRAIEVRFRHFLRREETYPDAQSLKAQILNDVARSEAYWQHVGRLAKAAPSIY